MNRDEFIDFIEQTYKDCVNIIKKKNSDYAKDSNPFSNFELSKLIGIEPKRSILVRLSDKLSRISNLLDKPPAVVNESIADSIKDAANYLVILLAYIENGKTDN